MRKSRFPTLAIGALFGASFCVACGGGLDGVEKRLAAMQEDITQLQNRNDRLNERIEAIEARHLKQSDTRVAGLEAHPQGTDLDHPPLEVVKLVPNDTDPLGTGAPSEVPPGDSADDPGPRPLIQGHGQNIESREPGAHRDPAPAADESRATDTKRRKAKSGE
jgi:hypothetical protein